LAKRNQCRYKYILANSDLKIGTILRGPLNSIISSPASIGSSDRETSIVNLSIQQTRSTDDIKPESLKLREVPIGTNIFNISLKAGDKGKLTRAAGTTSTLLNIKNQECIVRLPSNKIISLNENCLASIGRVSNINHSLVVKGKAGTNR